MFTRPTYGQLGRLTAWVLCMVVLVASTIGGTQPAGAVESSSRGPKIQSLDRVDGPVSPHVVTIRGSGFAKVRSVTFGAKKATKVRVVSSSVLRVTTPRMTPGTVTVLVKTAAKKGTAQARYRFVGAPVVTSLSVTSGPLTGGTVLDIRGRDLDVGPRVSFGGQAASSVKVVSQSVLRVTTPVSYAQDAAVAVTTKYGTSRPAAGSRFRFIEPAPIATGEFDATAGTTTLNPATVASVTAQRDQTGAVLAWTASTTNGASVLAAGAVVLLEPGADVYPSGLAGRVTSASAGTTGQTLVIAPVPLEEALAAASVEFAGPIGDLTGDTTQSRATPAYGRAAGSVPSKVGFGDIKSGAFECENSFGEPVDISGKATLEFTNLNPYFKFERGSVFADPFIATWLSYERTAAIEISGSQKAECKLSAVWQNTHKKLFIGPYGASFSFAPALEFSIGAKGTVKLSQHSYHMNGFISNPDGSIRQLKASSADPVSFGVSGSISAEAYAGLEVQVGWLDRIGVGISGGLSATASVEAGDSDVGSPQACGSLALTLKASLYAYLDVWVKKWKLEGYQLTAPLKKLERCWPLVPFTGVPDIYTTSFPDVGVGHYVDRYLDTDDSRDGTWQIQTIAPSTTALPPGLTLDGDNISGVVTTPGTYPFRIVFKDEYGHTVTSDVVMVVRTVAYLESRALTKFNELRDEWGCDPFTMDPTLQGTARAHAQDMADYDYFEIYDLDGNDPGDRMTRAGYDWNLWSESIGRRHMNADVLFSSWKDHDGIFDHLTSCNLFEAGFALVYSDHGVPYWVLDQAEPEHYFRPNGSGQPDRSAPEPATQADPRKPSNRDDGAQSATATGSRR